MKSVFREHCFGTIWTHHSFICVSTIALHLKGFNCFCFWDGYFFSTPDPLYNILKDKYSAAIAVLLFGVREVERNWGKTKWSSPKGLKHYDAKLCNAEASGLQKGICNLAVRSPQWIRSGWSLTTDFKKSRQWAGGSFRAVRWAGNMAGRKMLETGYSLKSILLWGIKHWAARQPLPCKWTALNPLLTTGPGDSFWKTELEREGCNFLSSNLASRTVAKKMGYLRAEVTPSSFSEHLLPAELLYPAHCVDTYLKKFEAP